MTTTRTTLLALLLATLAGCASGGPSSTTTAEPVGTNETSSGPSTGPPSAEAPIATPTPTPTGPASGPTATPAEPTGPAAPLFTELRRCASPGGEVVFDSTETWLAGTDATVLGHLVDLVAAGGPTPDPQARQDVTEAVFVVDVDQAITGLAAEDGDRLRISVDVSCPDFAARARPLLPDGGVAVVAQLQDTARYDDDADPGRFVAPNPQAVQLADADGRLVALDGQASGRAPTRDELVADLRTVAGD